MYAAKENNVFKDSKLIVTVWEEKVSNERLENESWLDMRNRTQPQRDKAKQDSFKKAELIAEVLNSRND